MYTNVSWAIQKQWDTEGNLNKQTLLGSSLPTTPSSYYAVVIYGDISLPRTSHVGLVVKNLPANAGDIRDRGRSLDQEDPLEEGMALHSSILAWRIPMNRGAWTAAVHGVAKSQRRRRLNTVCINTF